MYSRDQYRLVRKDIAREYGLVTVESKKEGRKIFWHLSAESCGGLSRSSAIVLRIQPHTLDVQPPSFPVETNTHRSISPTQVDMF
jgi:hypothetical protein